MKHIFRIGMLAIILLTSTSCKKWLDINQSPNAIIKAPLPQVLTSAQVQLGFNMGSDIHRYSSIIAQHFAGQGNQGVQTREYMGYVIQPTDVNNTFRAQFYAGALADLESIIKNAEGKSPYYAGIAKILKAYTFHILVDLWGNVPFSEALKEVENLQPKYDNSQAIYDALFVMLDEGIANLNATSSEFVPAADDVIFAGNRARWRTLAYTLQTRLALRYIDKVARIDAILAKAGATFMAGNADNFVLNFQATAAAAGRENPIHQFEIRRQDQFFPNATFVNRMNTKADPRRRWYFTPVTGTTFSGAPNNYTADATTVFNPAAGVNFSRVHIYLRGDSTGTATTAARGRVDTYSGAGAVRMFTFAEYQFIRAEYLFAKGQTANAQTAFQAGITASMQLAGVPAANITTYIAANGTLNTGTELQQIIEEKYVANYGVAVEPWSDWRRTGFPVLTATANSVAPSSNVLPRILPYSQQEKDSNPNTPARANIFDKAVFWDR